jgi:hypothetical protein
MNKEDLDYADFKRKYKRKLSNELGTDLQEVQQIKTSDYETFKRNFLPKNFNIYEKICNFSEKLIPISPDKENVPKIEEAIRISHLNVSPRGTLSFAAFVCLMIVFASFLLGYVIPYVLSNGASASNFFFIFFGFVLALILFIPLTKLPFIISNVWRMKASNQMVLSVFYVVTYMRHTPNLELAINFAAEHLSQPLSLDFKKVLWDVETGKFDNINQSLDYYLDSWREYNPEFIESMHLIQSTLYESSDSRRLDALDKSLSVILDETFEKMLHFTHDLQGPITTLHMLGIVLPILGLVILPLLTAFMPETKWYHLFALYNILLPVLVYYLGRQILSTRPTGYGGVDLTNIAARSEKEKVDFKFNNQSFSITPFIATLFIGITLFIIGVLPLIIHNVSPNFDYIIGVNNNDKSMVFSTSENLESDATPYVKFLDYREVKDKDGVPTGALIGPYGLGASLLSLFIPLSFGLSIGLYYRWKTVNLEKVREETEKLEQEFASALFQLGNRLADGIPAEIAFSNVAKVMHGTKSGQFFEKISINIIKLGMGVEDAIFDPKVGAINDFPSSIIESSMKVFIESSKKGPIVASQAVISVAEYIKSMHRVDERLKDLMADTLSSMKSQVGFLTPIISGIVVGITSMIGQILGVLASKMGELDTSGAGSMGNILDMFGSGGVPTFYFQAIVGLYVVEITYVLSILINGIQNGSDKIGEMNTLGINMVKSTLLYLFVAGVFTIGFSLISIGIINGMT